VAGEAFLDLGLPATRMTLLPSSRRREWPPPPVGRREITAHRVEGDRGSHGATPRWRESEGCAPAGRHQTSVTRSTSGLVGPAVRADPVRQLVLVAFGHLESAGRARRRARVCDLRALECLRLGIGIVPPFIVRLEAIVVPRNSPPPGVGATATRSCSVRPQRGHSPAQDSRQSGFRAASR